MHWFIVKTNSKRRHHHIQILYTIGIIIISNPFPSFQVKQERVTYSTSIWNLEKDRRKVMRGCLVFWPHLFIFIIASSYHSHRRIWSISSSLFIRGNTKFAMMIMPYIYAAGATKIYHQLPHHTHMFILSDLKQSLFFSLLLSRYHFCCADIKKVSLSHANSCRREGHQDETDISLEEEYDDKTDRTFFYIHILQTQIIYNSISKSLYKQSISIASGAKEKRADGERRRRRGKILYM